MEVGSNLPPLKSDLLIEKKKELEEYQQYKKLKQHQREQKRIQKMNEKTFKKPHGKMRSSQFAETENLDESESEIDHDEFDTHNKLG